MVKVTEPKIKEDVFQGQDRIVRARETLEGLIKENKSEVFQSDHAISILYTGISIELGNLPATEARNYARRLYNAGYDIDVRSYIDRVKVKVG